MPQDLTDDKSIVVQVMAWCRQAASHYLSQCWPRSMSPTGIIRPQWVTVSGAYLDNTQKICCLGIQSKFEHVSRQEIAFYIVVSGFITTLSQIKIWAPITRSSTYTSTCFTNNIGIEFQNLFKIAIPVLHHNEVLHLQESCVVLFCAKIIIVITDHSHH